MHEVMKARGTEALPLTTSALEAVLGEYVQHIVSVGRAIKLIHVISEYDGILALKEFMESFVDSHLNNVEIEENKAKHLIATVLTKDLENLIVRIVALSTANPALEPILTKYTVSDELCYVIEEASGVNINKLKLNVEGKAKVLDIVKYIIASCNIVLK